MIYTSKLIHLEDYRLGHIMTVQWKPCLILRLLGFAVRESQYVGHDRIWRRVLDYSECDSTLNNILYGLWKNEVENATNRR